MKKIVLFLVLLTALLLAACGPQATPTPAFEPPSIQPSETHDDLSTSAPPPTAGASATVAPTAQSDGKVPVTVTLGDNWIKSNLTTFKVGVTYIFTVTNTGRRAHLFSISHPAEKTTSAINAARDSALYLITDDELVPGVVKTFEFTFKEAAPAGTLEFACLIERHYKMGQYLAIIVEP